MFTDYDTVNESTPGLLARAWMTKGSQSETGVGPSKIIPISSAHEGGLDPVLLSNGMECQPQSAGALIDSMSITAPAPNGWSLDKGFFWKNAKGLWLPKPGVLQGFNIRPMFIWKPTMRRLIVRFEVGKVLGIGSSYKQSGLDIDVLVSNLIREMIDLHLPVEINPLSWKVTKFDLFRDFQADRHIAETLAEFLSAQVLMNWRLRCISDKDIEKVYEPWITRTWSKGDGLCVYFGYKNGRPLVRFETRYRS